MIVQVSDTHIRRNIAPPLFEVPHTHARFYLKYYFHQQTKIVPQEIAFVQASEAYLIQQNF